MSFPTRGLATRTFALVLLLGVAGCGGDDKKDADKAGPTTSSTAGSTPGPSDETTPNPTATGTPQAGLPTDFPRVDVPLLAGPVAQPLGPGSGEEGKKGWVLELKLAQKADDCFAAASDALTGHGFTKQPGEINENGNRQAQFTAPGYAVIIATSPTDNGGCRLGYEVGQIAQ
jgi:hypothetical protein